MRLEEVACEPSAQVRRTEELRCFVAAGVGVVKDGLEYRPYGADDVARVAGVVDEDAVLREG